MYSLEIIGDQPLEFGDLNYLDNFRFDNGKGYPFSYKQFVRKYGYGLTAGLFLIYIPMGEYGDSLIIRSEEIKSTYYNDLNEDDIWFDIGPDTTIELIRGLIPFASSENGHYLFWNVTDTDTEEYDIYITDFRGIPFKKVADSLDNFIEKVTDKTKFKEVLPFLQAPLHPTFKPLSINNK